MVDDFKDKIKQSFFKVKEDISGLEAEIKLQKEIILKQNEILLELKKRLDFLNQTVLELKTAKKETSIGNNRVNQSINHLINQSFNQSITNQSLNHDNEQEQLKKPFINDKEVNQSFNQSINQQLINQSVTLDPDFQALKLRLDSIFKALSKQELKIFLTVYQLEDENQDANYRNIALKMQLSEHCIRSHISSLMKKNIPLNKKRTNNRINILSIKQDFRALNLKQRLINIYYETDPNQTTLFNLK